MAEKASTMTDSAAVASNSHITGSYYFKSSENFQDYLKELGVSYVLRSLAGLASPVVTISKNCDGKKVRSQ